MYCNLFIDKKNEEKLQKINMFYEEGKCDITENISLICVNYMYFYKLLHYVPLPKDIIKIIYEQLYEQINLIVHVHNTEYSSYHLRIDIESMEEKYASFWFKGVQIYDKYAQISDNVLQISRVNITENCLMDLVRKINEKYHIFDIVQYVIQKADFNHSFFVDFTKFNIVDYDKMLIICNAIYTVGKFIKKLGVCIKK